MKREASQYLIRKPRGFTLLVAIILSSIILALGMALADIAYKQVTLSASARQSEIAFYRADSALECALFYDQRNAGFDYTTPLPQTSLSCHGMSVVGYSTSQSGSIRETNFTIPCSGGTGVAAVIKAYKADPSTTATCNTSGAKTCLYATGYNTCDTTDPNRFERGLKILY